jgi:hypothetical protein
MLRFTVREEGQVALPPIVLAADTISIGSAADADVRLPAPSVAPVHVRIERGVWRAVGVVQLDGAACAGGDVGAGVTLAIGRYQIAIAPAAAGMPATPPQRTESLARELVRSLLGADAAPSLQVERGPVVGAKRGLAPPESILVIGRGDEADWILVDDDLSRAHAEIRRSWDGVRVVDLDSKNGTRLDGVTVGPGGALVRDGALVELGTIALRFHDPAEKHLLDNSPQPTASPPVTRAPTRATSSGHGGSPQAPGNVAVFYAAVAIMVAALAGLVWVASW